MSSSTSITKYDQNNQAYGWTSRVLLLSELVNRNINEITINTTINILQIISHNDDKIIDEQVDINNDKIFLNNPCKQLIWKIDEGLIEKFKNANYGKSFESNTSNDNMWLLSCHPTGMTQKYQGWLALNLQLCYLPPSIKEIKIEFALKCIETGNGWQFIYNFYEQSDWGHPRFFATKKLNGYSGLPFSEMLTTPKSGSKS